MNPEQWHLPHNQESRRDFIKKVTGAFLSLEFAQLGLFSKNTAESKPSSEEQEKQEVLYEQAKDRLERQIREYTEQKTTMSEKEIRDRLANQSFIDAQQVSISEMTVEEPWIPFSRRDILREEWERAVAAGEVVSDGKNFSIVQVDFEKIGALFYGSFYQQEKNALFLNQQSPEGKKASLSKIMYEGAISEEFREKRDLIFESNLSEEEKKQKEVELREWFYSAMEKKGGIEDIPQGLMIKHANAIEERAMDFRFHKAMAYAVTKTNIDHEMFHYFFFKKLNETGYAGSNIAELLFTAIKNKRERFGKQRSVYEVSIEDELEGIDVDNDFELMAYFRGIEERFDLTQTPHVYSDEQWRQMTDEQKQASHTQKDLSYFLDEYLARIYNGAQGYTPEKAQEEFNQEAQALGREPIAYKVHEMYHKPTQQELDLLTRMKFNGKPVITPSGR